MGKRFWLVCVFVFWGVNVQAVPCVEYRFESARFVDCVVEPATLEVFWRDENGTPFGDMPTLGAWLATRGRRLVFAMNAGIFETPVEPTGLLVANGIQLNKINVEAVDKHGRPGNFFAKPNGVFWVKSGVARIDETMAYVRLAPVPDIATQSGPLLMEKNGEIPASVLKMNGKPPHFRNGVCVTTNGHVHFSISDDEVTIATLAHFMRDKLGCTQGLYLDGCRSILRAESPARDDKGRCVVGGKLAGAGPIIGVAEPRQLKASPGAVR
jgi:uncharacterized protein YigE (DUF2233 family)